MNTTCSQSVTKSSNISSNVPNILTYNTHPPSAITQPTIPQPIYINSSTSISKPMKPFDGLDHNYTPKDNLQHIEARVTLFLGLQPYNLITKIKFGTLEEWLLYNAL